MGKRPWFEFYPADWAQDLEEHPLEMEGAWIRIICKLWWSPTRGRAAKTIDQWARVLRTDVSHAKQILTYIKSEKIGEISDNLTEPNAKITVVSRRMVREEKDREANRLRQQRYYKKNKPNAQPNGKVTPPSSRESSSHKRVSREDTLSSSDKPPTSARSPTCPHKEIIQAYHETLPELPPVKTWGNNRQAYLRSRWKEDRARQSIDWWRGFFQEVRGQPFLMGQKTGFQASLEWLIRPKNFPKVLEGHYRDNGQPRASPGKPTPAEAQERRLSGLKEFAEEMAQKERT